MSTVAERLAINTELVRPVLVNFLREEIRKVGYGHAVLGLSGGIDSAVTCGLTAEALGAENVLAVLMPYRSSSPAAARSCCWSRSPGP